MSHATPDTAVTVPATRAKALRSYFVPAACSAVMLALCYPPPAWGWLAHVALVPLAILAVRAVSPWRLAWTCCAVTFLWWLVMLRWLWPVTGGGYAALAAFMAVYLPLSMVVFRALHRRVGLPAVLSLPMALVSVELLRGCWPAGGFTWFGLGHTQAPHGAHQAAPRLAQVADLFGEHGVSFLVGMTNGVIVDVLTRPWFSPRPRGLRLHRPLLVAAALWLFTFAAALAYGCWRIATTPSGPVALHVMLMQTNVPQSNKDSPEPEVVARDWQDLQDRTRQAVTGADPRPDLVVWPETMVPGPLNPEAVAHLRAHAPAGWVDLIMDAGPRIASLSRDLSTHLLVGASAWSVPPQPQVRYNSVYHYDRAGAQQERRYDKMHRVPFGEYLPWIESWPWLRDLFIRYLTPYDSDYTIAAGVRRTVFSVSPARGSGARPVRLVTPVCFEDMVPRVCRRLCYGRGGVKRADLLVNLTNDAWYSGSERTQHLQMATLRSIENRVPGVRSVNTGVSALIDSAGRIRSVVPEHEPGALPAAVVLDRRRTLFGLVGHTPMVLMSASTAALLLIPARSSRRRRVLGVTRRVV